MKASQLIAAEALLRHLSAVTEDIDTLEKSQGATVSIHIDGKTAKFKPLRKQYKEFLATRREAITSLLTKMGIEVDI